MIPRLEFSAVRYLNPLSVRGVKNTLKMAEKGRREEEQKEAARVQYRRDLTIWEARKKTSSMGAMLPAPQDPDKSPLAKLHFIDRSSFESAQRRYRGPEPNVVLELELHNKGKTAANDITGYVSLDKSVIEILDFPGLDADEVSGPDEEGLLTARVGVIDELLPGQNDSLRVAAVIRVPPEEPVIGLRYDFITPAGHATAGEWKLSIPGSSPA